MHAPSLRFAPYDAMAGAANVVVDGSPTDGTVLSLSHWPHLVAPLGLAADLSAQMAFAYLDRFDLHGAAELVSNNHFDQDGLVSVYALIDPDRALARRDLLIDIAAAGDFATYRSRTAARISMAIAAFADPDRSPLTFGDGDRTGALYEELLGRLPEMMDDPDRYRDLWADEDDTLHASEALVRSGQVRIEEDEALDLAVCSVPPGAPDAGGHRFGGMWVDGLHPMAINNATDRFALLCVRGRRYEFTYRHRWSANDLLMWDNRCTMHIALSDYDLFKQPRHMIRCSLAGPKLGYPYTADDTTRFSAPLEQAATSTS